MNIITRSARRATRYVCGNGSLAKLKTSAHRANRAVSKQTLAKIMNGAIDADDANFMPKRSHMVTAYEIC